MEEKITDLKKKNIQIEEKITDLKNKNIQTEEEIKNLDKELCNNAIIFNF